MSENLSYITDVELKSFIEKLDFGILKQGPDAEILISNTAALNMLGLTEDQLLGKTSFDPDWNVIHEDGSPFPGTTHPVSVCIATLKRVKGVVMGVYRPTLNDRVWLLVNADPEFDTAGNLVHVICTFNNITSRIHALNELQKSESQFRNLYDSSPIGIALTRMDNSLFVNHAFAGITGYTIDELNTKKWMDITHPDDIEKTQNSLNLAKANREVAQNFEKRYIHKNGGIVIAEEWLVFNAETQSFIKMLTDITEKKRQEEKMITLNDELIKTTNELSILTHHFQRMIENERSSLALEIHNEFAQKFVAINLNAELIKAKLKNSIPEVKDLIKEQIAISSEVIRSSKMLFNSLYPTVLHDLGLLPALESYIQDNLHNQNIAFNLQTNLSEKDKFSEEINLILYRIFVECVGNTLKYANASKVTANIIKMPGTVTMVIEDNGIGFDINAVNKKDHHGLIVMRERAYSLNGQFEIFSALSEGTKVTVTLPL